jgi:hypothetical protein
MMIEVENSNVNLGTPEKVIALNSNKLVPFLPNPFLSGDS